MAEQALSVALGDRSYPIRIGRGLAAHLQAQVVADLEADRRLAVLTDVNVAREQSAFLRAAFGDLPVLALPAGESTKAFRHLERVCDFLADVGLDRDGRLFAVGGGVIGDLGGFAAASYFRGIPFYQVPTSLLAMVDSSVGGKTGINLKAGKNLVGAFHQPLAVFADLDTLRTLPGREFSCGMAEVIKHGMLAERELFEELERMPPLDAESADLGAVIRRNCAIKAAVVSADEQERASRGGRALLNLGHTFGHAIEAVAGYGAYLHGEAVAIGLVLATRLSVRLGTVEPALTGRVESLLRKYHLPVRLRESLPLSDLLTAAHKDKKARAGAVRYVVLEQLGRAATVDSIAESLVAELWRDVGAAPIRNG
jgi:3-dehydroquinate synthase